MVGVTTSVRALAKAMSFVMDDRVRSHQVWSDVRTSLWFRGLEAALESCRTKTTDAQLQHLRPMFDAHAGYLFVADSQIERREANIESLDRLVRDLRHVRRDPASIGVVFGCNTSRKCAASSDGSARPRSGRLRSADSLNVEK